MKKILCIGLCSLFLLQGEAMIRPFTDSASLDEKAKKIVHLSLLDASAVGVTLGSLQKDSDCLYIGIDDFLSTEVRKRNYHCYINYYKNLVRFLLCAPSVAGVHIDDIMPCFKKFVEKDIPGELIGNYEEEAYTSYQTYMKDILSEMEKLQAFKRAFSEVIYVVSDL